MWILAAWFIVTQVDSAYTCKYGWQNNMLRN